MLVSAVKIVGTSALKIRIYRWRIVKWCALAAGVLKEEWYGHPHGEGIRRQWGGLYPTANSWG